MILKPIFEFKKHTYKSDRKDRNIKKPEMNYFQIAIL